MKFNISYHFSTAPLTVTKEMLEAFQIGYFIDSHGNLEVSDLPDTCRAALRAALARYGIGVEPANLRTSIVQRTRQIIHDIVDGTLPLKYTLSVILENEFGMAYSTIAHYFSEHMLTSIESYYMLIRIEAAKQMLLQDSATIQEISNRLAFSSVGHFSKRFRSVTGITVTNYRNIIRRRRNDE